MYVPGFSPYLQESVGMLNPAMAEQYVPAGGAMPTYGTPGTFGGGNVGQNRNNWAGALAAHAAPAGVAGGAVFDPETGMYIMNGQQGYQFMTDRGRLAGYGSNASGFIPVDENSTYRLWDERGKNRILSSGTGQAGLQSIYTMANQLNNDFGKKANWGIERLDPTTGKWVRVAENDPAKNIAGKIADVALPIAGALLLPGVGGALGGALGAGLGAAGGSALSSVAQGRSLGDTLLRAGLSGVAAGGLSAIGGTPLIPGGGGGGSFAANVAANNAAALASANAAASGIGAGIGQGALGGALGSGLGGGLADGIGNIIVSGVAGGGGAGLGAGLGAGAGALAGGALAGAGGGAPQYDMELDVTGNTQTQPGLQPVPPVVLPPANPLPLEPPPSEIVVEGNRPTQPNQQPTPPVVLPGGGGALPAEPPVTEIVVEGNRPTDFNQPPAVLPPIGSVPTNAGGTVGGLQPPQQPQQQNNTLDDVIKYLRAAGLLSGLVGGAVGGGGQPNGTIPAGLFNGLNPAFSGGLPAANLPGASNNFAQRPVDMDWKRYGYGPGQSFFDYVPQGQPNNSDAFTGYAEGGGVDSFAVQGPGTGRSDDIPALLSDGEYVIDAETVALLGDGSTKAGAERLDAFRVNVRKHKGAQLAKGGFSADAKRPEHYLKGGLK